MGTVDGDNQSILAPLGVVVVDERAVSEDFVLNLQGFYFTRSHSQKGELLIDGVALNGEAALLPGG